MNNYIFILIGITSSAMAQIILKRASMFTIKDLIFYMYMCIAALFYLLSFVLYAYILKHFPISKASPIMTIGTMICVIIAGFMFFRETINIKLLIGLILGIFSIYMIIT